VGRDVAAPFQERAGARRLGEHDRAAGRDAVHDEGLEIGQARLLGPAGGEGEVHQVAQHLLVDVDLVEELARLKDPRRFHHLPHRQLVSGPGHALDDATLLLLAGVIHHQLEHEAVHLRLRQRIGAFLFDRVLRRQHQEGLRQRARFAGQRHLSLLHRLQQRGLHLGRGAVDLVRQHEVAEDRSEVDRPLAGLGVIDLRAGQVGRQQVGSELDAPEGAADGAGQRLHGHRLGEAGHALDQHVAVGQ